MVFLELIKEDDEEVIYYYMPENKDSPKGIVSVNKKTKERKLIKKSSVDNWSEYTGHAWKTIDSMIDGKSIKREAFSAWY